MSAPTARDPLLQALTNPATLGNLDEMGWRDLIHRARQNHLLARIAVLMDDHKLLARAPEKARCQLAEAVVFAERNRTNIRFEVNRIVRGLASLDTPIILLKGAAYLLANLQPARGRFASDVDIMVPREQLESVEQTLINAGWIRESISDYDDHYYRAWMHEIPPLWHPDRLITVDIHHTILPTTSRFKPNTEELFAAAVALDDPRLRVLCPADMVLHSAVHLFNEDFGLGLRDLTDLHDLLDYFGQQDRFWDELLSRSRLHGLERPLYYLLRFSKRVLGTSIPLDVERAARVGAPPPIVRNLMDHLIVSALTPPSGEHSGWGRAFALWLLYLRSHWLKMPPMLLARHLCIKAYHRWGKSLLPPERTQTGSR